MNLGDYLRRAGWTDADLAERVGCSRPYVTAIRNGTKSASPAFRRDAAVVLARELDVDADQIRVRSFGPEPAPRHSVFGQAKERERSS